MKRNLLLLIWLCTSVTMAMAQQLSPPGSLQLQPNSLSQQGYLSSPNPAFSLPQPATNSNLPFSYLNAQLGQNGGNSGGGGPQLLTTTCGVDTVLYPLAKATDFNVVGGLAFGVTAGQWYEAPQPITIHGFSFYAWVDSNTVQSVTLTCQLWATGPDSFPTGAALATQTIVIDSNFYNGNLNLLRKDITFTTPVTTASNYLLTISNPAGISVAFVSNDYAALPPDGLQEWLAQIFVPGIPVGTWYHTNNLPLAPPNNVLDADFLFFPWVSYDIDASFTPDTTTSCQGVNVCWTNTSSPILDSRFYNQAAFLGIPEFSFRWNYDDGSPIDTIIDPCHAYTAAGSYAVELTDSMFGWTLFCDDRQQGLVTVTGGSVPLANFSSSLTGATATFTDLSSNAPTSWEWDFGDASPVSTLQNPVHTYPGPGTYNVCLIVENSCGRDTFCDNVIINCVFPSADFSFITTGLTATFTDLSTGPPATWAWDFGDGSTSTSQNPVYTYATADTFTVCLIVTNSCGADTFCQDVISGCNTSIADYTFIANNLTFDFTDASTFSPTSWIWDFGDGSPVSTVQNPTHTYGSTGTYTVCLTVSNGCNSNTFCDTINAVCPIPNSNWTFTASNLTLNFINNSTGSPTAYFWDFDDGTTSTSSAPTHIFPSPGVYNVCLVSVNTCGADTLCQNVTVVCPLANPSFTSSVNQLQVSFTNTTGGTFTSLLWDFGDGSTSIQTNPVHNYSTAGTYTVCLIALNSCGPDTFCQTVTAVCPLPNGFFNFSTNGPTVTFSNGSTGTITSHVWDFGDGSTSTANNPTHTYSALGTYNVCLYNTSICGTDTFCRTVIITCIPPTAGFTHVVSNDSIATFTSTSSANTTSWFWDFGDGTTSTQQNPTHTYGAPGTYTACLTVTSNCGTDQICSTVTITCQFATSAFTASLSNGVATFTDQSLNAASWSWNFGDGTTSNLQNPVHSYTSSNTYTVCLTVTSFCGTNTSCQNVVVTCNPPQPNFTYVNGTGVVNFTGISNNQTTSWNWNFGDGNTSSVQNPSHGFMFAGNYYVCLTVVNSCASADTCKWVTVTTISNDDEWMQSFNLYPNPNNGQFAVDCNLPSGAQVAVSISDLAGREVKSLWEGTSTGMFHEEFSLNGMAKGIYMLRFEADGKAMYRKVVVE